MRLDLYLTPVLLDKASLEQKTVVIIDVLRATTTICAALAAGARGVIPVAEPGEAAELRTKLGADVTVLAGERGGVKIENFALGNSPMEQTAETVGQRFVILTTTNGSGLFPRSASAALVIAAALANVSAVAARVASENRDTVIVCAGTEGAFSIEDTLCGGMLVHYLSAGGEPPIDMNDAASIALLLYRTNKQAVRATIEQGEHARFLAELGFADDIRIASDVDAVPLVPVLRDGRLVVDTG